MYALIEGSLPARWGMTLGDVRDAFPHVSFPTQFDAEAFGQHGIVLVVQTDPPVAPPGTAVEEVAPTESGGEWAQSWQIVEVPDAINVARQQLIERVTEIRWERETGGITLPGGVQVATTVADQNRITSVIANAQLAGVEAVDFKALSGWVTASLAQVQGIAVAIALHVQACFTAERTHHEALSALTTLEALQAYDITAGWPEGGGA